MEPQQTQENKLFSVLTFVWETAKIIVISLVIIVPIRYFVVQPFFVRGDSMSPSFRDGEYLVIDEISYRFSQPERGQVVVFRFPQDPSQFFIKRIVGLPGETIVIEDGDVIIRNAEHPTGVTLEEAYLTEKTTGQTEVKLDANEYFVLGDNRDSSSDSRRWGPLPEHLIVGKVWVRAWPLHRAQAFEQPNY